MSGQKFYELGGHWSFTVDTFKGNASDFSTLTKAHVYQRLDLVRCEGCAEETIKYDLAVEADLARESVRSSRVGHETGHVWQLFKLLTIYGQLVPFSLGNPFELKGPVSHGVYGVSDFTTLEDALTILGECVLEQFSG